MFQKATLSIGILHIICGVLGGLTSWIRSFVGVILLLDTLDMIGFESLYCTLRAFLCILRERSYIIPYRYLKCNTLPQENFLGILPLNCILLFL